MQMSIICPRTERRDARDTSFHPCDALHWVTPSSLCEQRCGRLHHLQLFRNAALRTQQRFIRGQSSGLVKRVFVGGHVGTESSVPVMKMIHLWRREMETLSLWIRRSLNLQWTQKTSDSDHSLSPMTPHLPLPHFCPLTPTGGLQMTESGSSRGLFQVLYRPTLANRRNCLFSL